MAKEEIGQILKELRLSCGKTQKEVAELLGRKQQIVGHWETGYSQPDANTLFTLCDIYGTTVDAAFGFKKSNMNISRKDIELLQKYHYLDDHGREMVDFTLEKEWERSTADAKEKVEAGNIISMLKEPEPDYLAPNAAHPDDDSTPEERQAGDAIMTDDSEWE